MIAHSTKFEGRSAMFIFACWVPCFNEDVFMKIIQRIFSFVILLSIVVLFQCCWLVDDSDILRVCNSECTIVAGKLTTEDGNVPVANIKIVLNWRTHPVMGGLGGGKTRKITTAQTDQNGDFRIEFFADEEKMIDGYFRVEFNVPDNSYLSLSNGYYFNFSIAKRDTVVVRGYHIPKKGAMLRLKIKNPQDIIGGDNLKCSASFKYDDLTKQIQYNAGGVNSAYVSEAIFSTAANQYTYIKVSKKIGGQYINQLDSVIVSMDETRTYEVEF
jgi:5-hydroxyisourate hydrolase-like protein (transthyretin family)